MTLAQSNITPHRDTYRFGSGESPSLQPGTVGWSVQDLDDPQIRALWDAGRYEIIGGALAVMPATSFRSGMVVDNLKFALRDYFARQQVRAATSSGVELIIEEAYVLRADAVLVLGDDFARFDALRIEQPGTTWEDHPLTLPPTLIVESVSPGHELHDRRTKFRWYAEFGVPNYWIVDAYAKTLDCYALEQGAYSLDVKGKGKQILKPSAFEGLQLRLPEIWDEE